MSCLVATDTIFGQYFDIKSKNLNPSEFLQYSSAKYGNTVKYNTIAWANVYQQLFFKIMKHNIYKMLCMYILEYLSTQKYVQHVKPSGF